MAVPFGRLATGNRHYVGFLFSVQLPLLPWSCSLIEGALHSLLYKPSAYPANRRSAYQQSTGDLMVSKPFVCFQQDQRSLYLAGRRSAPTGHLKKI